MSAPVTRDLTPFPPKPETIQQLLSAGEDLARLMESPVLNLAWVWTIQALTEEWVESRPEDKAKKRRPTQNATSRRAAKTDKDALHRAGESAAPEHGATGAAAAASDSGGSAA